MGELAHERALFILFKIVELVPLHFALGGLVDVVLLAMLGAELLHQLLDEWLDPDIVVGGGGLALEKGRHRLLQVHGALRARVVRDFVLFLDLGALLLRERVEPVFHGVFGSPGDALGDLAPLVAHGLLLLEQRDVFPLRPGVPTS